MVGAGVPPPPPPPDPPVVRVPAPVKLIVRPAPRVPLLVKFTLGNDPLALAKAPVPPVIVNEPIQLPDVIAEAGILPLPLMVSPSDRVTVKVELNVELPPVKLDSGIADTKVPL